MPATLNTFRRHGLAMAVCVVLGGLPLHTVQAAEPSVQQQQRHPFNIPAGPLEQSLVRLSTTAGVTVSFTPDRVEGIQAPALQGSFTAQDALGRLLSGSGLVARALPNGSYSVQRLSSNTLEPITVNTTTVLESAHGPVDGYVATRSATATKTDTAIMETPQSISVVSREEMDDRDVRDIGEAVSYTAGVSTGTTGETALFGGNSVKIRGFGGSGTTGTSYNEYLDGLKLKGSSFVSANLDPWFFERVEVIKGPASVLFGQSQPGGIVNMVSKRPQEGMVNKVRLGSGDLDRASAAVDVGGGLSDGWSFRLVGRGLTGETQQDHSDRKRHLLAPSLRWRNDTTDLTLLASYQRDDINATILSAVPRAGVFDNPNGRVPLHFRAGDAGFEFWDRETWSVGYLFSHRFTDTLTFRQNARFTDNKLDSAWLYRRSLDSDRRTLQRSAFTAEENARDLTVDNQLELKLQGGLIGHTVLAGVDYYRFENDTLRGFASSGVPDIDLFNPVYHQPIATPPIYQDIDNSLDQVGVYLQDQINIGALSLLLGGRYDDVETSSDNNTNGSKTDASDHAFTGRAGVIYNFSSGVAPYVSYSESFEPVSGTAFDGSRFEPMEGEQYEVGVKYQPIDTQHLITLSYFDLTQKNMTTTDPGNPGFSIQTGEVRTRGVELEAKAQVLENLNLTLAYTRLDDEITESNKGDEGNRRAQLPEDRASLWLDYSVLSGAFSGAGLGAGVRYQGATEGDDNNTFSVPSYTLVDLALRYDLEKSPLALPGWQANIHVNNLLDKYYIASCSNDSTCFLGQERSIRAAVEYNW